MRDINGQWTIQQSNGFEVMFDIVQDGEDLHGSGTIRGGREANGKGKLVGDSFSYTIDWNDTGGGGLYSGQFDPNGFLHGITFDLDNPSSQATWFATDFIHT